VIASLLVFAYFQGIMRIVTEQEVVDLEIVAQITEPLHSRRVRKSFFPFHSFLSLGESMHVARFAKLVCSAAFQIRHRR
jgi:hypothetical protein